MKTYFNKSNTNFGVEASTWESTVQLVGELLEKNGLITSEYIESMIDIIKEFGPYCVIAPGIAMPHGRPEKGVLKTGVSLMALDKPVKFNHESNDPVDIVIGLAATDNESHLEMLATISKFLQKEENLSAIRLAKSFSDIEKLL